MKTEHIRILNKANLLSIILFAFVNKLVFNNEVLEDCWSLGILNFYFYFTLLFPRPRRRGDNVIELTHLSKIDLKKAICILHQV